MTRPHRCLPCASGRSPGGTPTPTRAPGPSSTRLRRRRRRPGDDGGAGRPRRPVRRDAAVRHRRAARRARRRAEPDEPGGRHPRRRRAGRATCSTPGAPAGRRGGGRASTPGTAPTIFARDTVAVMTGGRLPGAAASPAAAHPGARVRRARTWARDAGVMVTASHNPPQDNGYKVYLGGRADRAPARRADRAARGRRDRRRDRARSAAVRRGAARPRHGWTTLGDDVLDAYLDARRRPCSRPDGPRDLRSCYTPLHGVGGDGAARGRWRAAGFAAPYVVAEQAEPDPDFPTVAFPNPEEPGAMDLALAAAADARRRPGRSPTTPTPTGCAVAVPRPGSGRRLADAARRRGGRAARPTHLLAAGRRPRRRRRAPARSSSSQLLARIAAAHGRAARRDADRLQVDRPACPGLVFGYEEALGYCVAPRAGARQGRHHRRPARRRAGRRAEGRRAARCSTRSTTSPLAHGVHATDQLSVRVDDLTLIAPGDGRTAGAPAARWLAGAAVDLGRGPARTRRAACRPPTACATARRTASGWWSGPAAPSRSSSATWRPSSRSRAAADGPRPGRGTALPPCSPGSWSRRSPAAAGAA